MNTFNVFHKFLLINHWKSKKEKIYIKKKQGEYKFIIVLENIRHAVTKSDTIYSVQYSLYNYTSGIRSLFQIH